MAGESEQETSVVRDQLQPDAFSETERRQIREAIRQRYREVSKSPSGKFAYPTGRKGLAALKYDLTVFHGVPEAVLDSFCGVGNPFAIGELPRGGTVLDIGCGAGIDLLVAAAAVGPGGAVHGVDLTAEMLERAARNIAAAGSDTIILTHVSSESLPFADGCFDSVISNGVINLSPRKQFLFEEIFRVCKPGGRLQFADIVREGDRTGPAVLRVDTWDR